MATTELSTSVREHRKRAELGRILVREEVQARVKKITSILKKDEAHRTPEELLVLQHSPDVVSEVEKRIQKRLTIKDRTKEIEDPPDVLAEKCERLAAAVQGVDSLVIYTGAGISTAASIPDYRGPNGVWTLMQKGKQIGEHELSDAEPTTTHMAIAQLYRKGLLSHVVSQNCDGLHLRSGLPRQAMSEVHGNMYIEVCVKCKPPKEYIRLVDVTERTSLHKHKTGRKCYVCGYNLIDTIVHFGEKGILKSPLNWSGAVKAANKCGMILCLGSSLKVLRKYTCLWGMSRPPNERPILAIVNLQWTPKDHSATLKINGKCDEVMKQVMENLNIPIPDYCRENDPIFRLAHRLRPDEDESVTRKALMEPPGWETKFQPHAETEINANSGASVPPFVQKEHSYARYLKLQAQSLKQAKGCEIPIASDVPDSSIVNSNDDKDALGKVPHKHFSGKSCENQALTNSGGSSKVEPSAECEIKIEPDGEGDSDSVTEPSGSTTDDDSQSALPPSQKLRKETSKEEADDSSSSSGDGDSDTSSSDQRPSKPATRPGWFGKGYRKWQKKRKRL